MYWVGKRHNARSPRPRPREARAGADKQRVQQPTMAAADCGAHRIAAVTVGCFGAVGYQAVQRGRAVHYSTLTHTSAHTITGKRVRV